MKSKFLQFFVAGMNALNGREKFRRKLTAPGYILSIEFRRTVKI